MTARALAFVFVLLLASPALADELVGRVVGITDGDALRLLIQHTEVVVRLDQIDAPEKAQPFGQSARQSLADLCFGKTARVVEHGRDRYGRTIGTVYVGGRDLNAEQVRLGMAWVFTRYARDPALYDLEQEARAAKRGLWRDPDPVPPWEWRQRARR
jgi:endonuclease YncB( thermonuclease family)